MKKKYKEIFLNFIGVFFLLIGILAIQSSLYKQTPTQILYMCYIGLILIGGGILTRNSFIVLSQIYILVLPLLVWDIDFLYQLIVGSPLFGITDYFFAVGGISLDKVITLQHLFTIPVSIYAVKLIGVKRYDAWKLSFVQITFVYILVNLVSSPELNVNCVFYSCVSFLPSYYYYNVLWFVMIFSMTFISSVLINLFLRSRK
ncbi:MAG: hypothetical protein OQK82_03355 [Candidatus Pacearchaeota archaeon]|nr:hypothetical protein [Candidatus Pacearchaeota archaeon]